MYKVIEYEPANPEDLERWLTEKMETEGLMLVTVTRQWFIFLRLMVVDIPVSSKHDSALMN